MSQNTGQNPDIGDAPIDIKLRNGHTVRDTTADKWRWKPWDWGQSDWDIVDWQFHAAEQTTHRKAA